MDNINMIFTDLTIERCLFNVNYLVLFSSDSGRTGIYIAIDIIIVLLNQSTNDLSKIKILIMDIVNQ
jgi:protein tyrosine phosphatase